MSETKWTTFNNRKISIKNLEDQHLSNIYWFSKIFHNNIHCEILDEIWKRFGGKPLEYKPLGNIFCEEMVGLRMKNLIHGDEIILDGKIIGTIKHLNKQKYLLIK